MKSSLAKRLSVILLLTTLIILLSVGYGYFTVYRNSMNEQSMRYARDIVRDTTKDLESYVDDLKHSAEILAAQPDIYGFLNADTPRRFELKNTVRAQLASFANYKHGVVNVYMRSVGGMTLSASPDDAGAYSEEVFLVYRGVLEGYDLSSPFKRPILTKTYRGYKGNLYACLLVPVYQPVAAPQAHDYIGALVAVCDMQKLTSTAPASAADKLLVAEDGQIVFTNNPQFALAWEEAQDRAAVRMDGNEYYVLSDGVEGTGWRVYILCAFDDIRQKLQEIRVLCLIIAAMTVLAQSVLLFLSYRSFIRPLLEIISQIERIQGLSERIVDPSGTENEFTQLTAEINNMLARMEQMNRDMMNARLAFYKERVLFLQAQINPHFLYNNLQCIRGMAAAGDGESIREMVSCMAHIYRYGGRMLPTVRLQEEIECLRNYARIIGLRYDDRYRLEIDCSEDTLSRTVPRMLLQPLVENSVVHGFVEGGHLTGTIRVSARALDDALSIVVRDDGAGLSAEQIDRLNRNTEEDAGVHMGIANVRNRLELIYHGHAELKIKAFEREGTEVVVKIAQ